MADATARQHSLRDALDASVHETLRFASGILAALLGLFAIFDLFTVLDGRYRTQVALFDLACAAAFLGIHFLYQRGTISVQMSPAVGAAAAALVSIDILHDTYFTREPVQMVYLMLVTVATGSLLLHRSWVYAVAGLSLVGALAVRAALGTDITSSIDWTTVTLSLFAACVLAVVICHVRIKTFERLESLRMAESGRKQQLEIRESALESAVSALQESEERYRRLVDDAPDAFIVQSDGRIVFVNAAATRMLGAKASAQLLGRDLLEFFHEEDRALFRRRSLVARTEGGTSEPAQMRVVRLDGNVIHVESLAQPIMYLGRPADQTVLRDVTDRKRAEAERAVASQRLAEISRLKEMDRVKTQFVNTISHELRTPLTPIKVQLHILKGAKDVTVQKKATEVLERNVQRLSSLVDELLEVARIQAGTLKLAKTYVDVSEVVSHTLDSFVDVARQNGIDLASKLEPEATVLGDAKRLQQVMYNLLGNAFKFTEKGGSILVEVRKENGNAIVSVRDSGAGIEPDDAQRLFEPFSQLHDTMEKTNAGTGLGLYICRGIVEGHGGKIFVESEGKGKGSRFAFAIPLSTER